MKILLYGLNYSPELTGIGKYSGELAERLSQNGHDVRVITAPPYYPEWKIWCGYSGLRYKREIINGVDVFRVPIFVPKKPTTMSRLLHLISYSISSIPIAINHIFWRPDVVVFVQPTLFASLSALLLSKFSGAKSVMHIQDYEIDAMFGLGMAKRTMVSGVVTRIERWIMSHFDFISTISYSMMENAKRKGVASSRLLFFPNWADTEFVTPDVDGADLKKTWGFTDLDIIFLYSGNMGRKQGLELVLDAAEVFKNNKLIHFVLVGTGAHVDVLKDYARIRKLSNVHFKPLQPWETVPEMLSMADVHLLVQKRGAADAVLPSKLTNILAVGGHAIVTAEKDTELGVLQNNFPGIYHRVDPENIDLFVDALRSVMEEDLSIPNMVARNYAVEFLSENKILSRFENDLNKISY